MKALPYQKQNMQVRSYQLANQLDLAKCSRNASLLAASIQAYIGSMLPLSEQVRQLKHINYDYDQAALQGNIVYLSNDIVAKWIGASTTTKETNRKCKKAFTELLAIGYLHPLSRPDHYFINPLFFYQGRFFADVYENWCQSRDLQPQDAILRGSRRVAKYEKGQHLQSYTLEEWQELVDLGMYDAILSNN